MPLSAKPIKIVVEIAFFLIIFLGGFWADVAPPEDAGGRFATALAAFSMFAIFLLIAVLSQGVVNRRFWLIAGTVLLLLSIPVALKYKRDFDELTFLYPYDGPPSAKKRYVGGGKDGYTQGALSNIQEQPGLRDRPAELVAGYRGVGYKTEVWTAESIKNASIKLTANYIFMLLTFGAAIFCLLEAAFLKNAPRVPSDAAPSSEKQKEKTVQEEKVVATPADNLVFVSYSHDDTNWLLSLGSYLAPLIRNRVVSVWNDTQIRPGAIWRDEINKALEKASVAVLLVTPAYLESTFIAENERPILLKASKEKGLTMLWVAVSHSLYKETELETYQAVNDPEKPLDTLSQAELAREMVRICEIIKAAVLSR